MIKLRYFYKKDLEIYDKNLKTHLSFIKFMQFKNFHSTDKCLIILKSQMKKKISILSVVLNYMRRGFSFNFRFRYLNHRTN